MRSNEEFLGHLCTCTCVDIRFTVGVIHLSCIGVGYIYFSIDICSFMGKTRCDFCHFKTMVCIVVHVSNTAYGKHHDNGNKTIIFNSPAPSKF